MPGPDLEAASKEAEALLRRLEDLARQADAVQRDLRRIAGEQAERAMHSLSEGDLMGRLDALSKQADEVQRNVRLSAEEQAEQAVRSFVAPERQAEALAVVHRAFRIADEVGAWMASQGYMGLVKRLEPELRAGYDEVQALLRPAPAGDLGVAR